MTWNLSDDFVRWLRIIGDMKKDQPEMPAAAPKGGATVAYPSGRVRLPNDPAFPAALVEVAPDGRRYLVELVRVAGRKRLHRVAEVGPRES